MANFKIIFLLVFFVFASCKKDFQAESDIVNIDMSSAELFPNHSAITSIEYTPLQTDNAPLIGKIRLVKASEGKIYFLIRDGEKCAILVFNNDGSYFGKIEQPGEGPGEFMAVNDFIIDTEAKTIEMYDMAKLSIIRYGLDLSYIDEIAIDYLYKEFVKFEDKKYAFYTGNKDEELKNLIYVENGNEIEKRLPFPIMGFSVEGPHFSDEYVDDQFLIHDSFNDTIYTFNADPGHFRPRFILNFGKDFVDEKWISDFGNAEMMKRMNMMNKSGKIYSFKYLSFIDNILLTAFYNFTEGKFYLHFYNDSLKSNNTFYIKRMDGIPNNFDLGPIPRFLAFREKNKLIFYIDAEDITDHMKTINNSDLSQYPDTVVNRYNKLHHQLSKIQQNDNPVLMTVTLNYEKMFPSYSER